MIRDGVSPMGGFILPPRMTATRAHVRLRLSAVTGGGGCRMRRKVPWENLGQALRKVGTGHPDVLQDI